MVPQNPRDLIGRTPQNIQALLDTLQYDFDLAERLDNANELLRSTVEVVGERRAICSEAALAAAWLLSDCYNPYLISMYSSMPEVLGHVVCGYQDPVTGKFGALAFSRCDTLKSRTPEHQDERSVMHSYQQTNPEYDIFVQSRAFGSWKPDWGLERITIEIETSLFKPQIEALKALCDAVAQTKE